MDIETGRRQHRSIIDKAAVLGGQCSRIKTRADAEEARRLIDKIGHELVGHLVTEDAELYPLLMSDPDAGIRNLGTDAYESMGGLLSLWLQFDNQWTVAAMLADPRRFAAATAGVLGVLALRIESEEDNLYPAAAAAARRGRGSGAGG